jgi:glycosyltransferase involved in cell wall biosynthesis
VPYRFHVLGVPHTVTNKDYVACAFTQKVLRLCAMLTANGHKVYHYGHPASRVLAEHVDVITQSDLDQAYGEHDWHANQFKFDVNDHAYRTFYGNAIKEIMLRKQPNDFLLCMWGAGHRPVAQAFPDLIHVEPGIGYPEGHFAPFKIFESYAMLHAYLGLQGVKDASHPANYDVVIPNYFDPNDFTYKPSAKRDYMLQLGRVTYGKGVHIAIQAAEATKKKLIIAGQGSLADVGYPTTPSFVEHIGYADVETRRKLMSEARGLYLLSQYVEPFGGVQIEALMSGTPTITTDWGAMAENNLHGITGYRCRTFEHITWATNNIRTIKPSQCRSWAVNNFSMTRVSRMYEEYFWSVMAVVTGRGWYEPKTDRADLNWLEKHYPKESHGA